MASIKQMETKDGKRFFKISVSRGYGKSAYTTRWYWPDGWSKKAAEREVNKVAAEFELRCSKGEILNRAEEKQKEDFRHKQSFLQKHIPKRIEKMHFLTKVIRFFPWIWA